MAFTNLTQLTQQQYEALNLTGFSIAPGKSNNGTSPDPRVNVNLGGWVSETVLAFTLTVAAGASAGMVVGPDPNELVITVVSGVSNQPFTIYATVDVGTGDSKSTSWSINFDVTVGNRDTGTWTFTKGKTGDDQF